MVQPLRSGSLGRFSAAFMGIVLVAFLTASVAAAPVELQNDKIDVDGGNVTETDWLNPGGEVTDLGGNLNLRGNALISYFSSRCSAGEAIEDIANDGTITCTNLAGVVADTYVNETGDTMRGNLSFDSSYWIKGLKDPVSSQDAMTKSFADSAYLNRDGTDSMTGSLDMSGYNILNVDALGNGTVRTIQMDTSGNVDIPNGILSLSAPLSDGNVSDVLTVDGGTIRNSFVSTGTPLSSGNISSGAITDSELDNTAAFHVSALDVDTPLDTGNITDAYVLNTGDQITGDLDFSNSDNIQDAGTDVIRFDGSQNVEVPNGNLTVNSNWIKSVHDPSSSQDAMTKSFADSAYLNRDGTDSMSGNLDLDGHDIVNVDEIGNSTQDVGFTSDVDLQGNSVTTSTGEVCIGDECA